MSTEPVPSSQPPDSSSPAGASTKSGGFIHLFAQHRVAANLLMAMMIIFGAYSLTKLNKQFFPNFALDYISVRVVWPGASAEDVERSITVPLEQALRTLDGAKEMTSTTTRGMSAILIEYEENTDMGVALDEVKQFVSNIRHLPTDTEDPIVTKVTRYEPVATIILTADSELEELRPLAYKFERELLDKGIARVSFSGLPDQEIAIEVSANQIQQLGLSLNQIGERVINQSQDIPAGTVAESEAAREVRGLQRKRDVLAFASLDLLTTESGQKLTLGDIAEIQRRPKENQVEIFYLGQPAILMKLQRTETTDALVNLGLKRIAGVEKYIAMIRQRGMIAGLSTHMPETIPYADEAELDIGTYIQIYNALGFLMHVEVDWVHRIIWNASKPVITIKPLAAGRLLPLIGLAFVWATIRDKDMVCIGCLTPDEARECIDISLSQLERNKPKVELQKSRSKGSVI